MRYIWDPEKNRHNIANHRIAFPDAIRIFEGATLERVDDRFDYGDVRVYAIGMVNGVEIIGKTAGKNGTDWKRLGSLSDRQIRRAIESDPDVRPTDAEFWKKARVVLPAAKQTITIRLDRDLLEWLRKQKGYQTRINAVLRTYMDSHLPTSKRS